MTLPEIAEQFALRRELQPNSLAQYRVAIACLSRFLGRQATARDLSDETINRWLVSLEGRLSSATRRSRRNHLLALWRVAVRLGKTRQLPGEVRRIRALPTPPRAWPVADVRRILGACQRLPKSGGVGLPLAKKMELFVRLGWDTAARWGDVRTFSSADLSREGVLPFRQRKTGRIHVARLHPATVDALGAYGLRSWLVDWEYTQEYFRIVFRGILREVGLPGSYKWLRRSSATNVEMRYPGAGAAHLGHGPAIAMNHYLDARIVAQSRPMPEPL